MKTLPTQMWAIFLFCTMLLSGISIAHAAPIGITIDTSALSGTASQLAFDLIDGGPPENTIIISNFSTDGTLGTASTIGDVTGALPGTLSLSDSSFFNEYLQDLMIGSHISFVIEDSGNAPDFTSFPDGFSVFLLDPSTGLPLSSTSDPTGADSLFLLNIGISSGLEIFQADNVSVTATTVPEPNSLLLVIAGLAIVGTCLLIRYGRGQQPN